MGVYVLTDGQGNYIRKDNLTGKYVPIRSFKQAQQWDNQLKANSVLNNSLTKSIRNNYAVQLIDTENIIEKDNMNKQNDLCFCTIEDCKIDGWIDKVNIIINALSGLDARKDELTDKLSNTDKEIVDIQHYIEFGNFNCYQGWMCFKMLQNVLRQRRKYKNEISVINMIKQCKFDKSSLESLLTKIVDVQNQCYRPRVFYELFRTNEKKQ